MIMTFGKHRGKHIRDIPNDYLLWVLDNCGNLQPTMRREIRIRLGLEPPPRPHSADLTVGRVLEPWYRKLAREFHPDTRGSHLGMVAVNRARDLLVELTGGEQ